MHAMQFRRSARRLANVVAMVTAIGALLLNAGVSPTMALRSSMASAKVTAMVDFSDHPMVGTWLARTPGGPALSIFSADGSVVMGVQPTAAGPHGVAFVSSEVGTWEPIGERAVHFTAVQVFSDIDGRFVGTITIDGYPVVSEDGQTLFDDGTQSTVTLRDASHAVIDVMRGGQVTAVRMGVGAPGFPTEMDTMATPAASAGDTLVEEERIRAAEIERLRALVEADTASADQLHTEDFQLINPFGQTLSKEDYLGAIASGSIDYLVFEPTSEIDVRFYGETAVIRYQSRIEIIVDGERISDRGWHTDLYEKSGDRWQAVWSQMTAISVQ